MKAKVYLRVARNDGGRTRYKVDASASPNYRPLTKGALGEQVLPTISFAVVLDIPDEAFTQAERVLAEIEVPADVAVVAAEAVSP